MSAPALRLAAVHAGYGRTTVIEAISLDLAPGGSLAIIGRNGVGKTTLLETIAGHATLHGGHLALAGRDISARAPDWRCRSGLGYVPQAREVFPSLSVDENLAVAARPGEWTMDRVFDLFPNLAARRRNRGDQLSGGEQQMLSIGRALIGNPSVLAMDEPSEGLAPVIVAELERALEALRAEAGLALLLVEQNSRFALRLSERCLIMDRGQIVHDADSAALAADPDAIAAYLGVR